MTDTKLETVKVIRFAGRQKSWREWKAKVLAYAEKMDWKDALTEENASDKQKGDALAFLTMSLCGEAFDFVEHAETPKEAWEELLEEYAPSSNEDAYSVAESFSKCKLFYPTENPVKWFKRLQHLNQVLGEINKKKKKTNEDLKLHVKINLPKEVYSELLTTMRNDFETMTWRDLKKQVKVHWRDQKKEEEKEEKDEKNFVFNTKRNFSKKFKGRCRKCGAYGHKAAQCPENKQKKQGYFKSNKKKDLSEVVCFKCGQKGHYARDCPNDSKDEMFVGVVEANRSEREKVDECNWIRVDTKNANKMIVHGNSPNQQMHHEGSFNNPYFILSDDDDDEDGKETRCEKETREIESPYELTTKEEESVNRLFSSDSESESIEKIQEPVEVVENEGTEVDEMFADAEEGDEGKVKQVSANNNVLPELNYAIHHRDTSIKDYYDDWNLKFNNDLGRKNESRMRRRRARRNKKQRIKKKRKLQLWREQLDQQEYLRVKNLHKSWIDLKDHFDEFKRKIERKVSIDMDKYHSKLQKLECTYQKYAFSSHRDRKRNVANSNWKRNEFDRFDEIFAVNVEKGSKNAVNNVSERHTYVEQWLMDSGSTVHLTNENKHLVNVQTCNNTITVGTGDTLTAESKGTIILKQLRHNKRLILHDVLYVPGFNQNIISVSNLLQKGYTVIGNKNTLSLRYNGKTLILKNNDAQNMFYFYGTRIKPMKLTSRNKNVWNVNYDIEQNYSKNESIGSNLKNKLRLSEETKIIGENKKHATKLTRKRKQFVKVMDINEAHDCFGHMDETRLRALAKRGNIKLIGKLRTCVGCMEAKAQRKNVQKRTETRAGRKGERIFMDTSGPFRRSIHGHKYWFKLVDDFSRKNWNFFLKKKKEVPEKLDAFLTQMKLQQLKIDRIRCDNAGEHQSELKRVCNKHNIFLEFVAPSTPQHNGVVERSFTTDLWRLHAMMKQAQLTKHAMNMLWPYAIKILERIKNMSITNAIENNKTPNDLFGTPDEKLPQYLIEFGRIGYVTIRTKIQGKLKPRSKRCIMVGYAENHAPDTYLMYDPRTRKVIMSRDIRWADFDRPSAKINLDLYENREDISVHDGEVIDPKLYHGDPNVPNPLLDNKDQGGNIDINIDENQEGNDDVNEDQSTRSIDDFDSESDNSVFAEVEVFSDRENSDSDDTNNSDNELNEHNIHENDANDGDNTPNRITRSQSMKEKTRRIENVLRKLDTSYNPTRKKRSKYVNYHVYDTPIRHKIYNTTIVSDPGEPTTIKEAMNGNESEKWKPSIKAEIMNFIKRDSWEYVSIDEPRSANRKIIPCKWVFKIKKEQDGSKRYKSRLCVKGFHQVPGVDYTESFSPVATDSTIQILLLYTLWKSKEGWGCEMFDVEAAFLNAELENVMYLAWPEYMVELGFITQQQKEKECIKLVRSMYGNVDAALRWQKCFVETCIDPKGKINCEQSKTDPCLLLKKDDKGKVMLLIVCYVDDVLLSGTKETIQWFKNEFKQKYNITELGRMKKHLGMWYDWKKDNDGETYIKVTMDTMIKEIVELYEKVTGKKVKDQLIPGYPNKWLTKLKDESKIVRQKEYRSLVGKILYYVNKMDVACSNAVRELAQHLDSPGEEHWKALGRLVGYLKTRIGVGKIMRKPMELRVVGWSDSDYAKQEDRKSIGGNISTIGGSVVYGSSKGQNCVCLSSTEAEYVAMGTLAQEIRFEQQLLDEIVGKDQKYPSVIHEDNVGAIFLAQNRQVGQRTKHIDVRDHFIRGLIEDGKVQVVFTRSEDNYADILTKNVNQELFRKHAKDIDNGRLIYDTTTEKVMTIKNDESEIIEERHFCYSIRNTKDETEYIENDEESSQNEETVNEEIDDEHEDDEDLSENDEEAVEGTDEESNDSQGYDSDSDWSGITNREFTGQELVDRGYALPQDVELENNYLMIRRPQQLDEENRELLSRMLAESELEESMRRHTISLNRDSAWARAAQREEDRLTRTGTWGRPPPIWNERSETQQDENIQEGETKSEMSRDEFLESINELLERSDQAVLQHWRNIGEETQDVENVNNPWRILDRDRENVGWTENRTSEERSGWIRNENRPADEDESKDAEESKDENKENKG